MNTCTEKTERWPDTLIDVSSDEMEAFLAHAQTCLFHTEKLRAEEKGLQSVFSLARGLDGHGRILRGTALKKTIKEHERRHALWQAAVTRMKLPFSRIYLSNCGAYIAGSGKFFDFRRYEGSHSLDIRSGLQIWGALEDEGTTEEVLLGYYSLSLAGSRQTRTEELLPLDNGYTVGLRVEQLGDRLFKIEFRCVENEVLEMERNEVSNRITKTEIAVVKTSGSKSSFLGRYILGWAAAYCSSLLPSTRRIFGNGLAAGVIATSCLFVAYTSFPPRYKKGDLPEITSSGGGKNQSEVYTVQDRSQSASTPNTELPGIRGRAKGGHHQAGRSEASPHTRTSPEGVKPHDPDATFSGEGDTQKEVAIEGLGSFPNFGARPEFLGSKVVWSFQSVVGKSVIGDKRLVVHTGSDKALREKLLAEIRQRDFEVVPLNRIVAGISSPKPFAARWDIIRQENSVTVEVNLIANGETRFLSFCSDGTSPETTCDKAVRDAVSGVFAVMNQGIDKAIEIVGDLPDDSSSCYCM